MPPRPPKTDECCGRGCSPCIFDYYEKALALWKERFDEFYNQRQRQG